MNFSTPPARFALLPLSLTIASTLLVGCASSGSGSGSSAAKAAVTPNPFVVAGSAGNDQIKVNTLRVFGDSYSDPLYTSPRGILNWASALQGSNFVTRVENYALGGARSSAGQSISFGRQIATWRNRNSPIAERDLTVAYLGYNDVGRNGRGAADFAESKAGYAECINQLVRSGASNGTNRIFVTQIHDWSRNPGVNPKYTAGQIIDWNANIAGIANGNPNIIAVDLYTVFTRVMDDPAKYGFNLGLISSEVPGSNRNNALFYDAIHFDSRGMELIARTYAHYLTRAWNWSNAIEAGSAAAAQLNKDIDEGLLVLTMQQKGEKIAGTGFSLVPFGQKAQTPFSNRATLARSFQPFAATNTSSGYSGLALNFNALADSWTGNSQMGMALHQKNGSTQVASTEDRTSMGFQSNAASLYMVKPMADFLWTTQLSQTSQRFDQTASDDLILRSIDNSRSGNSLSLESKLRYTYNNALVAVTPWASLTRTRQTLDAGVMQTLYTSDVQFAATKSNELISGMGVDLRFAPLSLSGGRKLQWGGSLMHRKSISRDPFVVSMTEAAQPGVVQREFINRSRINQTYFGLNAQMDLNKHWDLSASYATDLKQARETQALQIRATAHF